MTNSDLTKCPNCGGPADNGHDRCYPPKPDVELFGYVGYDTLSKTFVCLPDKCSWNSIFNGKSPNCQFTFDADGNLKNVEKIG